MLTKMNLKKDRLKDIQDALGADGNGVSENSYFITHTLLLIMYDS